MKKVSILISMMFVWIILSGQTLNYPESIAYDYNTGWRYISNNGNGSIIRDQNDNQYTYFSQGLGGVRGLLVQEQKLFAATNLGLAVFDLVTDQLASTIPIPNSIFLNDVVADNSGNIYISDSQAFKIFKYSIISEVVTTFVDTGIQNPNGMVFDSSNDRLLIVSARANAPIQAIDLSDGSISTVLTTNVGSLDGLGVDRNGAIYFSSWATSSIYRLTTLNSTPLQIWTGISGPADFYIYYTETSTDSSVSIESQIWIPSMLNQSVITYDLPNTVNHFSPNIDSQNQDLYGWRSNYEYLLQGYNIYQSNNNNFGQAVLVTSSIIQPQNTENAVYFLNNYYNGDGFIWIESIEVDGTQHLYGPYNVSGTNTLETPQVTDITIDNEDIEIQWEPVTGATSYKVYVQVDADGDFTDNSDLGMFSSTESMVTWSTSGNPDFVIWDRAFFFVKAVAE